MNTQFDDITKIKMDIINLGRKCDIYAKFFESETHRYFAVAGIETSYKDSKFGDFKTINPTNVLKYISERTGRRGLFYPFGYIKEIHPDTYMEDFDNFADICRHMTPVKHAYKHFNRYDKIPEIMASDLYSSIGDIYRKYANGYHMEYLNDYLCLLTSFFNKNETIFLNPTKWRMFVHSSEYNRRAPKFINALRFINPFRNRNKISLRHQAIRGDDYATLSLAKPLYKKLKVELKNYPHVVYSIKEKQKNGWKSALRNIKDKKNSPWARELEIPDYYVLQYETSYTYDMSKALLKANGYDKYFANGYGYFNSRTPVFAIKIGVTQWQNWLSLSKANNVDFLIDNEFHFLDPDIMCTPVICRYSDYSMVCKIFDRLLNDLGNIQYM